MSFARNGRPTAGLNFVLKSPFVCCAQDVIFVIRALRNSALTVFVSSLNFGLGLRYWTKHILSSAPGHSIYPLQNAFIYKYCLHKESA